ncbi:arsenic efflux protein [bacterium]|nr:arsenic efflux protein [bacterium]
MKFLIHSLNHSLMITAFVFVMMVLVDFFEALTQGKMSGFIKSGIKRQYIISSFLGVIPGCLGAFMDVSLYVHGLITFGAIAGGMIATSGDESFVMLALFPGKALLLFGLLFICGVVFGWIADKLVPIFKIQPCEECVLTEIHPVEASKIFNFDSIIKHFKDISLARFLLLMILLSLIVGLSAGIFGQHDWGWDKITLLSLLILAVLIVIVTPDHYIEEHVWQHIFKKHIWKVFLWTFGALTLIELGLNYWHLESMVKGNILIVLILASLTAIIPESGPHLIFVIMFSKGLVPFSVLFASSFIQDGHGLLPLLSYSVKDSIIVKLYNFIIGFGLGFLLYLVGF